MSIHESSLLPAYEDDGRDRPIEKDPYGGYTFASIPEEDGSGATGTQTSSSSTHLTTIPLNHAAGITVVRGPARFNPNTTPASLHTSPPRLEPNRLRAQDVARSIDIESPSRTPSPALTYSVRFLIGLAQPLIYGLTITSLGVAPVYTLGGLDDDLNESAIGAVFATEAASVTIIGLVLVPAALLCSAMFQPKKAPGGRDGGAALRRMQLWVYWFGDDLCGRAIIWLSLLAGIGALPIGIAVSGHPQEFNPGHGLLINIAGCGLFLVICTLSLWPVFEIMRWRQTVEQRRM